MEGETEDLKAVLLCLPELLKVFKLKLPSLFCPSQPCVSSLEGAMGPCGRRVLLTLVPGPLGRRGACAPL